MIPVLDAAPTPRLTLAHIRAGVRAVFGVTDEQLDSRDRHKSIALARHVGMYLAREHLLFSYPEIGRAFGDRDHTTAMHACAKVEGMLGVEAIKALVVDVAVWARKAAEDGA